jgi:hypothetical protein
MRECCHGDGLGKPELRESGVHGGNQRQAFWALAYEEVARQWS